MSRKNYTLSLLIWNAILNAILINLKILHIVEIDWWLVFTPTYISMLTVASGAVWYMMKHRVIRDM